MAFCFYLVLNVLGDHHQLTKINRRKKKICVVQIVIIFVPCERLNTTARPSYNHNGQWGEIVWLLLPQTHRKIFFWHGKFVGITHQNQVHCEKFSREWTFSYFFLVWSSQFLGDRVRMEETIFWCFVYNVHICMGISSKIFIISYCSNNRTYHNVSSFWSVSDKIY